MVVYDTSEIGVFETSNRSEQTLFENFCLPPFVDFCTMQLFYFGEYGALKLRVQPFGNSLPEMIFTT